MVISRRASTRFWGRPRRRSSKYKRWSNEKLDARLAELDPVPRFHTAPRHHQKVSFLLGAKYCRYLLSMDAGTGKTWVAVNLLRWRMRRGEVRRALVLVPGLQHIAEWADQIKRHAPKLQVVGIDQVGRKKRRAALRSDADVIVMTYQAFLGFVSRSKKDMLQEEYQRLLRKRGGKLPAAENKKWAKKLDKAKGWEWDGTKIERLAGDFDAMVLDECLFVGNPETLMHRAVWQVAKRMDVRYALNGTLFGSDPEAIWGQFKVVDGGDTLGGNIGLFHEHFFTTVEQYWSPWPKHVFDRTKTKELNRVMQHRSIRYEESECQDLPKRVDIPRYVKFSSETWAYYEKLTHELADAKGNFRLVDSVWYRLRGIVAGFLAVRDPEGERLEVVFKSNPKLDALVELIRELPEKRKILIFCEYRTTGKIICERLKAEKIKHLRLYSATAKKKEVVAKFKSDPKVKAFVLSSAGARGLNLQEANYVIFYEVPTNPSTYIQEYKRAHRDGQERTVFVYHLIVKGSVDERIHKALRNGVDFYEEVMNGREKL